MSTHRGRLQLVTLLVGSALLVGGCGTPEGGAARCTSERRLALVAQSVPGAAYVPCIADLPPGWEVDDSVTASGHSRITLASDRNPASPVTVEFRAKCSIAGAVATKPRADGVRTHLRLTSIEPLYGGTLYDVFPGGCVSYGFAFQRGPHISLMEELQQAVQLRSRRDLRIAVRDQIGVDIDSE